ncbi:fluoroquinolone transport system permease protein [Natranaerovirga hydrolytica]|uniref:Fluoroquinolone transport system permease protein n=1 Tax=Natranaerovirga hydrolytica TaxID=680378 RepID=A0A4R1MZZ9_9FIRM|nr:ABC transporter permease [Natranaerovirga hydrolytica]TCK98162.1 fluoroquinolone transport system permease protein [Natranaerovirga hydrolytica]
MSKNYLSYELKKWLRDPLLSFLLIYPLILTVIARFAIPYTEEQFQLSLEGYYHIILGALLLMTALITGAIIGFSILDDRDDNILYAIDVSPVSFDFFVGFRFLLSFILTFITSIVSIIIMKSVIIIPLYAMLLIPLSTSLFSSVAAMTINCLATNKIEGFAMIKGVGMIIVLPIVSMFFTDAKEFFFAFEPNFWAIKALSVSALGEELFNLNFWSYYFIGFVYIILLNLVIFKVFKKRIMT